MRCSREIRDNLDKAERMVREAAGKGAKLILLPELFERQYFCQERRYDYYSFARPVAENDAVRRFAAVSEELSVVLPVSIYERDGTVLYNTVVMLDCGKNLGIYRKTHIPDDHFYQEKFYFTPGNTGFRVFDTSCGSVGMGICWDQWFPETARCLTLQGADILLYPTAIGSEPILSVDSAGRSTLALHLGNLDGFTPKVLLAVSGPFVDVLCHRRGGRNRVDGGVLAEQIGNVRGGVVAITSDEFLFFSHNCQ